MRIRAAAVVSAVVLSLLPALVSPAVSEAATPIPAGMTIDTIFGGYSAFDDPVAVKFAPDDRVFVAEKDGRVQVFDDIYDPTPTELLDISSDVHGWWDRGLLSLALHPDFESTPYLYGVYTWDTNGWGSGCPNPPGATNDGCVVNSRLSRWTVSKDNTVGPETVLIEGFWCQQFPSHSTGDIEFGTDGALYISAGDGANFLAADYGQFGGSAGSPTPKNPCGDPPSGVSGDQTAPTAEGGSLRSQDLLTPGDPVSYDGTIIRVDPITGYALPSNPLYDDGQSAGNQPDEARIIAYGLRNPYRIVAQPGSDDLWIGDVGWNNWDEVNRIDDPVDNVVENFGWPCYSGGSGASLRQSAFDGLDLDLCEDLYSGTIGSGVTAPHWALEHGNPPGGPTTCTGGGDAITGLAFVDAVSYPADYDGALLIGDYSNRCVWIMRADSSGVPDPSNISVLIDDIQVVDIEFGPGGEAYFVDFGLGEILRLTDPAGNSSPSASISASVLSGDIPLAVNLDASASADPEADQLRYAWDLDDDGQYDDAFGKNIDFTFTAVGSNDVGLEVTDFNGATGVATVTIDTSAPPGANTEAPVLAAIDDVTVDEMVPVEFTASATDDDLPAQSLTFSVEQGPGSIDGVTGAYSWTPGEQDDGVHDVVIRVTDDGTPVLFDQQNVQITVDEVNLPPTASISAPDPSLTWSVGEEISVSGSGSDPDQGNLPAWSLDWDVSIQHCESASECHAHNAASFTGASWTFSAPDHEFETWLTVTLTVTDEAGATDVDSVDILPETVLFNVSTVPTGLDVVLGSAAIASPFTSEVLSDSQHEIVAVSPQIVGGKTYVFDRWSDGVTTASRSVFATGTEMSFTALFSEVPSATPLEDRIGLVDPSQGFWRLFSTSGVPESSFYFGNPGDVPFVGDWDCNGTDTPGMYRQSDGFVYLRNANSQGIADIRFFFGNPGDFPIAGDFNGDGCDTVSLYRASESRFFIVNTLGVDGGGLGPAETDYVFGDPGDKPFAGDFDGDRIDTVGLHRESTGLVYFRNSHTQGVADASFVFGDPGDRVVAGDWGIVDGVDSPAAYRSSDTVVYLRHSNTAGNAESQFVTGRTGDLSVAGWWG